MLDHALLDAAGVLHPDLGAGEQALVDARRGEDVGRADLAAIVLHRLRALRTGDAEAGDQRLGIGEDVVADPGDRQIGDDLLVLAEPVEVDAVAGRDQHVVEGEHHPLRLAGGAGGVEHHGEVEAAPQLDPRPPARLERGIAIARLPPRPRHLDEGVEPAMLVVAHAALVVVDHVAQRRQAIGHRENLVDLFLVLGDDEGDLGVLQHIGHLVGDAVLVDRHRHRPERLHGGEGPIEPRPVGADHRHLLARLETEFLKAERVVAHQIGDLAPRPRLPDAEILLAHRRTIATVHGIPDQQFGKGVPFAGTGFSRRRHARLLPSASRILTEFRWRSIVRLNGINAEFRLGRKPRATPIGRREGNSSRLKKCMRAACRCRRSENEKARKAFLAIRASSVRTAFSRRGRRHSASRARLPRHCDA